MAPRRRTRAAAAAAAAPAPAPDGDESDAPEEVGAEASREQFLSQRSAESATRKRVAAGGRAFRRRLVEGRPGSAVEAAADEENKAASEGPRLDQAQDGDGDGGGGELLSADVLAEVEVQRRAALAREAEAARAAKRRKVIADSDSAPAEPPVRLNVPLEKCVRAVAVALLSRARSLAPRRHGFQIVVTGDKAEERPPNRQLVQPASESAQRFLARHLRRLPRVPALAQLSLRKGGIANFASGAAGAAPGAATRRRRK